MLRSITPTRARVRLQTSPNRSEKRRLTGLHQLAVNGPGGVELGPDVRLQPAGYPSSVPDGTVQAVDPLQEIAGISRRRGRLADHLQVDGAGVREQRRTGMIGVGRP